MELKHNDYIPKMTVSHLLIVPYGIETKNWQWDGIPG